MAAAAIPLAIGLGVAGLGMSAAQAIQQNRAINKAKEANRNAADVQKKQLVDVAAVEKAKREKEAAALRGRIAALSGESGIAIDAYSGLFQQVNTDLASNLDILTQNLTNEQARVESGLAANLAELNTRRVNPLFAGIQGGLQGAQTGLSIANLGSVLGTGGAATGSQTVNGVTYGPNFVGPIPR